MLFNDAVSTTDIQCEIKCEDDHVLFEGTVLFL